MNFQHICKVCAITVLCASQLFSYSSAVAATNKDTQIRIPKLCDVAYSDVSIVLDQPATATRSGEDLKITGRIMNNGSAPVVNVSLVARVTRVADKYVGVDDVVDRIVSPATLNIPGNNSSPISFVWNVPEGIMTGWYNISLYAVGSDQFNISGAEWSDNSATSVMVEVTGNGKESATLNQNSLLVNGSRLLPNRLAITDKRYATSTISIVHNYAKARNVSLTIKGYSSEVFSESSLTYVQVEKIALAPKKDGNVSFVVPLISEPLNHILLELSDGDKRSIYSFRVAKKDSGVYTIKNLSLDTFPIPANTAVNVQGCVSAAIDGDYTQLKTIRLSILNPEGKKLISLGEAKGYLYMKEFKREFTPKFDINRPISIKAELINASGKVESTAIVSYSCENMLCVAYEPPNMWIRLGDNAYYVLLTIAILGLIIARSAIKRRKVLQIPNA